MLKPITVQSTHLNGNQNLSLSTKDVRGMVEFGFALGC